MNTDMVAIDVIRNFLICGGIERGAEPAIDLGEECVRVPPMFQEQKLQTRLLAVLAKNVAVSEYLGNGANYRNDLIGRNKRVQFGRKVWVGREAAGNAQRESVFSAAIYATNHARQANVIDLRVCAPMPATGHGDFEFSRKVVELGIADENLVQLFDDGRCVKPFFRIDSR